MYNLNLFIFKNAILLVKFVSLLVLRGVMNAIICKIDTLQIRENAFAKMVDYQIRKDIAKLAVQMLY